MDTKTCSTCKLDLDLAMFWKNKNGKDGRLAMCRTCCYNRDKNRYAKAVAKGGRDYKISRACANHHISRHDFDLKLASQGGRCGICYNMGPKTIDHDHRCCPGIYSCGKCFTGLLCDTCNMMIGLAGEDQLILLNASRYVLLKP